MSTSAGVAEPPDWGQVDYDVHCPRCGYNVRLLPQPRCPECGLEFVWGELLAAAERRVRCPLFEYQWRRHFRRSFLITVGRALWPWRLWTGLPLAYEPQVGPLFLLALLVLFVQGALILGPDLLVEYAGLTGFRGEWWERLGTAAANLDHASYLWAALGHVLFGLLIWLALQIFQQTIARYGLRQRQLLRIIVLAGAAYLMWQALLYVLLGLHCALVAWLVGTTPAWNRASLADEYPPLLLLSSAMAFLSLAMALSVYLKVRRGWVVGLMSAVVVCLFLVAPLPAATVAAGAIRNPWCEAVARLWPGLGWLVYRFLLAG